MPWLTECNPFGMQCAQGRLHVRLPAARLAGFYGAAIISTRSCWLGKAPER